MINLSWINRNSGAAVPRIIRTGENSGSGSRPNSIVDTQRSVGYKKLRVLKRVKPTVLESAELCVVYVQLGVLHTARKTVSLLPWHRTEPVRS